MVLGVKNCFHQLFVIRHISYLPCTRLKDKVVVVTASTAGIGFAIAKRLGLEGAKVSISSRNQSNVYNALEELKKMGITAIGSVCDVNQADARKKLLKKVEQEFGSIDVFIPNMSRYTPCTVLECEEKDWDDAIDMNLKSTFFFTKEALPFMLKKKTGKIIYIASVASYRYVEMFSGAYSIAKTGILGLTKILSWQLALQGITVNAVAPGLLNTKSIIESDAVTNYLEQIPLKRLGKMDDIAAGVAFLASDDASYITGEIILIGGGMSARL
ncbi:hypothetical protein Trydic_g16732 [Trypoxylus dichotomus]